MTRVLYVVGGPPRVGKSALGRRIMERRKVPWLSTDILRTVLRIADSSIDEVDRGHPDPGLVAEQMYPYLERTADVALNVCERFLIEGVEWLPTHLSTLDARLRAVSLRACFLGNVAFSEADLAHYQGLNRWHDDVVGGEREGLPEWIRGWSDRLRTECAKVGQVYIDVGELGFQQAMVAAELELFGESEDPPTSAPPQ